MKTLPLTGLPTANEQLVKDYGDLLQDIFGYDGILLHSCETAEKHGMFEDNLLNRLIESGILSIANYKPGAGGGIEVTFELTALGFVTKALSIQNKILAGAAYYRRDEDESEVSAERPIELDPPLAPPTSASTPTAPAEPLELSDTLSQSDGGVFAPARPSVPTGYQPENAQGNDGERHAFLVEDSSSGNDGNNSGNGPVGTNALEVPLEDQTDAANGAGAGESFEIPRFLQRAREENRDAQ